MGAASGRVAITASAEMGLALQRLAASLAIGTDAAALGCLLALAYRHLGQSPVAVRVSAGAHHGPSRLLSCAIADGATLRDVVTTAARAWREPPDAKAAPAPEAVFEVSVFLARTATADRPCSIELALDGSGPAAARLRELADQLQLLAIEGASDPLRDVFDYSLITPAGRAHLPDPTALIEAPAYPWVTALILEQARQDPRRVAVIESRQSWSYQELACAAAGIAAQLRASGVADGDVIALSAPRGFTTVSGMLGVFLCGGVLLTLDPKLPRERQRVMLQQAGAQWALCTDAAPAVEEAGLRCLRLDTLVRTALAAADSAPVPEPIPQPRSTPAYIFFTSGSTGTPKAVLGTHAGLAHFLHWQRTTFGIGPQDRGAQTISLSFDALLRDAFMVLTAGGTLCVPRDEDILQPSAILPWLARERVTLLHLVPSLLRTWLHHIPDDVALPRLRYLFLSGEPVTDVLVNRFRQQFGDHTTIVNLYGPSETTMVKCHHEVRQAQPGVQPIGQPMTHTQVLILNSSQRLCGLEESGQIAIRTPYRTLGYLHQPAATQRVFVPNPFRTDADDLIYLTGDRGRYRCDGVLEIGGRMDSQVKIRGVRVEPAEIEHAICQHGDVDAAAVAPHEHESGGKYLVAYLVPRAGIAASERTTIGRVRAHLQAHLPDYMVPASFVVLQQLPLGPNGKVDMKALHPPARVAPALADADLPATELERRLMRVWAAALGHDRVSVNDSFGALGGDSLTSVGVIVAMKRIGIADGAAKGIFTGASIRQIAAQTLRSAAAADARSHWGEAEMPIVIRALSIVLVVMGHFGLWDPAGTIKALLIVSGLSFARFQLHAIRRHDSVAPLLTTLVRLALPTFLYTLLLGVTLFRGLRLDTYLFFDNFVDPTVNGSAWFIELLLQCLLLTAAPLALRPVRRFALRQPYVYGLIFMGAWWAASRLVPLFWNTDHLYNRVPQILLWLMAYGWCAAFSDTVGKKLLSTAALLFCMRFTYEWFGWFPLVAGLAITWHDRIPIKLPPPALALVNMVAAASLFIYLTHMQFDSIAHRLGAAPTVAVIMAVLGGVVLWYVWDAIARGLLRLRRGLPLMTAGEAGA